MTNNGICNQCGTYNTETLRCNCANKKLQHTTTLPLFDNETFVEVGMKFDNDKLLYSLIPTSATKALAEVLTYGAKKYAPNNWQLVDNGEVRYMDALFRHLEAFRSGETHDPESGLHHLAHVLTNTTFLHYLNTKESNEHR